LIVKGDVVNRRPPPPRQQATGKGPLEAPDRNRELGRGEHECGDPRIMVTKQEQYAYLSVSDGPEMSKSKSTAERLDAGENDSTWPFPVSASTFNISLKVRQITENNNVTMF